VAGPAFSVTVVVAAYRRPERLRALLTSLADASACLREVIVVDNGRDAATRELTAHSPLPARYVEPEANLGCGGGIRRGLELGLQDDHTTHFCFFDDDAEATPGAVDQLVAGMIAAEADLAVPIIVNARGFIGWYPGLQEPRAWRVIRQPGLTPGAYLRAAGPEAVPFTWAPWPAMAVSARAVRAAGFPRDDFWFYAEDLEYSLRLTHRFRGVLVPGVVCRHLPPDAATEERETSQAYLRFCLLLQNISCTFVRLPHGRRALRHLPGNYLRFLRQFGVRPRTIADAARAFWNGAIRARPAGVPGGDQFKQRFLAGAKANAAE
jgi:GT2 family glycosyltransferase